MKIKTISAIIAITFLSNIYTMAQMTLAEATKGKFLFGVAVNMQQVDGINPTESELIAKEFNAIVAENCMKPQFIHPKEDKYQWTDADKFVAFGEKNKQVVTGHCLIWHSQIGRWFLVDDNGKDVTPEVLKERMRQHIITIVG
ncbi:MAG: endo-1,4-beta-xylanase, partial [Chitinophagaceae bacterium]